MRFASTLASFFKPTATAEHVAKQHAATRRNAAARLAKAKEAAAKLAHKPPPS